MTFSKRIKKNKRKKRRMEMIKLIRERLWKTISGIVGAIQTLLIVLRFFSVIDCSWWIVFSPFFVMAIVILLFYVIKCFFRRKE